MPVIKQSNNLVRDIKKLKEKQKKKNIYPWLILLAVIRHFNVLDVITIISRGKLISVLNGGNIMKRSC